MADCGNLVLSAMTVAVQPCSGGPSSQPTTRVERASGPAKLSRPLASHLAHVISQMVGADLMLQTFSSEGQAPSNSVSAQEHIRNL